METQRVPRTRRPPSRELHTVVQKPGETLRSFVNRFSNLSYSIPEAEAAAIVNTFAINVCDPNMREKPSTHWIRMTQDLYALAHITNVPWPRKGA